MSGKVKSKGSLHYDSHTNTVITVEDEIDEQVKIKVSKVLEVCPTVSTDDTILVLQHYGYDIDSTVNAFTENGAADILQHWRHLKTATKPSTKTKKKKNKKKKGQVATVSEEAENSSDNSHNVGEDSLAPSQEEEATAPCNREEEKMSSSPEEARAASPADVPLNVYVVPKEEEPVEVEASTCKSSACSSPQSEVAKYTYRDRHRSSGSSRTASFSEDASRHSTPLSSTSTYPAGQGKKSLERSMKDLSRQTVALQRIHNLLEEELDNSFKRIKNAIGEAHKLLEDRNQQLEEEMEKVKKDARQLLKQRQELSADLKQRSERAPSMTEVELNDLRADIKHFVVERKYDEELGKTVRFMWDKDRITQEIKSFGEIAHVKICYSQRRQSSSSVASSSNIVTSNSEPLENQTSESPVDSGETPAAHVEETTEQKDYRQQVNRPRVFFNKGYSSYTRPNHRPFYPREGRGRGRGWDNYRNQPQHYPKYPPYHQRFPGSESTEDNQTPSSEFRPPYRGNRPYRGRGRGLRPDNYDRSRRPSKDLHVNGEAPKPADSSTIANGFVAH